MQGRPLRVLELRGDPAELGAGHGNAFAPDIRAYTADRTRLAATGTDWSADRILDLAERMLPAHDRYAPGLFTEMGAMAEAAGITPAEAVVVGGYTDFIDAVRTLAQGTAFEDTCTAVIVPDAAADGAGFLAQTWDMHASATPHVVMLRLMPTTGPGALVFTTVGTLGQIGMNEAGIAIGITNLTTAGQIGVTWPFVVRRALAETDLDAAIRCVVDAPVAGGHSFLLFDATGRGVMIEAAPGACEITDLGAEPLVHTNHCLVSSTRAIEGNRPEALQRSSTDRLADASELLAARPVTPETLMALTRDERSISRRPDPPFDYETSGSIIMRPSAGDVWACWGLPAENEYEHLRLNGPPS